MKIYQIGDSIKQRIREEKIHINEHLCVLDNTNVSIKEGLDLMLNELPAKEISFRDDDTGIISFKDSSTYTLATEKIIDKNNKVINKVSNLLRYIYSRDFTIDMLYFDEDEGIVDLSGGAADDIRRRNLRTITPFPKLLSADNTILAKAIYYRVMQGYQFSDEIDDCLRNSLKYVKPLQGKQELFSKMFSGSVSDMSNLFYCIGNYPYLEEYIMNYCKINISVDFNPSEEDDERCKKALEAIPDKGAKKKSLNKKHSLNHYTYKLSFKEGYIHKLVPPLRHSDFKIKVKSSEDRYAEKTVPSPPMEKINTPVNTSEERDEDIKFPKEVRNSSYGFEKLNNLSDYLLRDFPSPISYWSSNDPIAQEDSETKKG